MDRNKIIVVYATISQFLMALFIIFSPHQIRVAQLGVFYDFFPSAFIGAVLMLLAVFLAAIGLYAREGAYKFLFFIPQHAFLLITAGSALHFIFQGHYADGVVRSWQFIFIDQLPAIITAALYTIAIFDFRKRNYGK